MISDIRSTLNTTEGKQNSSGSVSNNTGTLAKLINEIKLIENLSLIKVQGSETLNFQGRTAQLIHAISGQQPFTLINTNAPIDVSDLKKAQLDKTNAQQATLVTTKNTLPSQAQADQFNNAPQVNRAGNLVLASRVLNLTVISTPIPTNAVQNNTVQSTSLQNHSASTSNAQPTTPNKMLPTNGMASSNQISNNTTQVSNAHTTHNTISSHAATSSSVQLNSTPLNTQSVNQASGNGQNAPKANVATQNTSASSGSQAQNLQTQSGHTQGDQSTQAASTQPLPSKGSAAPVNTTSVNAVSNNPISAPTQTPQAQSASVNNTVNVTQTSSDINSLPNISQQAPNTSSQKASITNTVITPQNTPTSSTNTNGLTSTNHSLANNASVSHSQLSHSPLSNAPLGNTTTAQSNTPPSSQAPYLMTVTDGKNEFPILSQTELKRGDVVRVLVDADNNMQALPPKSAPTTFSPQAEALKQSLPKQLSFDDMSQLVRQLSTINQSATTALPAQTQQALTQLMQAMPDLAKLTQSPEAMKQAIQTSGVFAESQLLMENKAQLPEDLKLNLSRLKEVQENLAAPRLATIPTEQIANAIERITTSQLRHFPDSGQISTPTYPLHIELPIRDGSSHNLVQVEINKDAHSQDGKSQDRRWLVKLKFDFEETGKFEARTSIQANKVSIIFVAEEKDTLQRLQKNIPTLKQQLNNKDIEVERLDTFQAKLAKDDRSSLAQAKPLIDVRT